MYYKESFLNAQPGNICSRPSSIVRIIKSRHVHHRLCAGITFPGISVTVYMTFSIKLLHVDYHYVILGGLMHDGVQYVSDN